MNGLPEENCTKYILYSLYSDVVRNLEAIGSKNVTAERHNNTKKVLSWLFSINTYAHEDIACSAWFKTA